MKEIFHFLFQPNGYVLFRDYAVGDLAQVSLCGIFFRLFLFIYLWFNKENEKKSQQHQKVGHCKSLFMIFYFLNYSMTLLLLAVI